MRKADNLPPSCAVVTKSVNLNFLEPSGPLRACDGTALPLLLHFNIILTQPRRFYKLFFTPGLYAKSYVCTRSQSISKGNYFFWPQYGNGIMEYIRSKERGVYLKILPSDGICEECTRILRANVFRLAISS